jgi:hypothetical protein
VEFGFTTTDEPVRLTDTKDEFAVSSRSPGKILVESSTLDPFNITRPVTESIAPPV